MGLGKTKLIIDVASHLHAMGKIDAVLVIAPNEVYTNWLTQELPPHMAAPYAGMAFNTSKSKGDFEQMKMLVMLNPDDGDLRGKLRFVCGSYDSLRVERGFDFFKKFIRIYRTLLVADESSKLKNPAAQQTKRMKELGEYAHYRWIATGTPATESPFALHSQIEFLDPEFWAQHGYRSLSAFKNEFAMYKTRFVGKRRFNELQEYRNLDKLRRIIEPITHRLLKEDSGVELPPKLYTTRSFEMADEQRRLYDQLRDECSAELANGMHLEAPMAIVRLTRLQQIACGHVSADEFTDTEDEEREAQLAFDLLGGPGAHTNVGQDGQLIVDDPAKARQVTPDESYADWFKKKNLVGSKPETTDIEYGLPPDVTPIMSTRKTVDVIPPGENPRLQLLLELIERARGKVIVFCRFKRDVSMICEALGEIALRYDGATKKQGVRQQNLVRYRDPKDPARVLVANVHAMSMGVTLTIAKTMIYYSNSFSLEKRLQSEDRFHRIGQDQPVQIIDLVAEHSVDEHVVRSLREKFDIQRLVTGDRFREWIG